MKISTPVTKPNRTRSKMTHTVFCCFNDCELAHLIKEAFIVTDEQPLVIPEGSIPLHCFSVNPIETTKGFFKTKVNRKIHVVLSDEFLEACRFDIGFIPDRMSLSGNVDGEIHATVSVNWPGSTSGFSTTYTCGKLASTELLKLYALLDVESDNFDTWLNAVAIRHAS